MDYDGKRGRRGRGRGFGGGFRKEGGFNDRNEQRSDSKNWRSRDTQRETNSETGTEIYVDQSLVGRIIGKGGSKIRELQETSGANIKVNSREVEDGKVRVVVSGNDDSRSQAEELIKEIVETFNGLSTGDSWGGGGGGRSGGRRGWDDRDYSNGSLSRRARGTQTYIEGTSTCEPRGTNGQLIYFTEHLGVDFELFKAQASETFRLHII